MVVHEIVALIFLAAAAWFDVEQRRIPNSLIAGGLCVGLILGSWAGGMPGVADALLGAALGLALFVPLYALRAMGAGDVKLLSGLGAILGSGPIPWIALYSVIAGGVIGLAASVLLRWGWLNPDEPSRQVRSEPKMLAGWLMRFRGFAGGSFRLPYAIAICSGFLGWAMQHRY